MWTSRGCTWTAASKTMSPQFSTPIKCAYCSLTCTLHSLSSLYRYTPKTFHWACYTAFKEWFGDDLKACEPYFRDDPDAATKILDFVSAMPAQPVFVYINAAERWRARLPPRAAEDVVTTSVAFGTRLSTTSILPPTRSASTYSSRGIAVTAIPEPDVRSRQSESCLSSMRIQLGTYNIFVHQQSQRQLTYLQLLSQRRWRNERIQIQRKIIPIIPIRRVASCPWPNRLRPILWQTSPRRTTSYLITDAIPH